MSLFISSITNYIEPTKQQMSIGSEEETAKYRST